MSGGAPESRGPRRIVAAGVASLVVAGVLAIFAGELADVPSAGPDSFSPSALGHRAFAETLRGLGYQVLVSRHATAARGRGGGVVIVAEPILGAESDGRRSAILEDIAGQAQRMLLVLPKRTGRPGGLRPQWIDRSGLVPVEEVGRLLDKAINARPESGDELLHTQVVRLNHTPTPAAWTGKLAGPTPPALDAPQLIVSKELTPLLATADGTLVGELRAEGRHFVVLSDPDLIATHGLGKGDNALLAVRILELLAEPAQAAAGDGATVLIDETLHGHSLEPSLAREFLRYPVVLATLHAALVAALLAWAAAVRFGRARRPAPQLAPGKAFLIDNTAALLRHGGHVAPAIAAYWRTAKGQMARLLRGPAERAEALDPWLARVAAARGHRMALARLEGRVAAFTSRQSAAEAVRLAEEIHRFREEMTHGAVGHPRHR